MIETQAVMRSLPLVASVIGKKADIQGSEVYKEFFEIKGMRESERFDLTLIFL